MKYCIAGKNNISVEVLLYLLEIGISKEDIFIIINKTDEGIDSWQRSLLKKSLELNLNIVNLKDVYNIEKMIFLSLEFDKIINPSNFKSSHLYNIHFSLLPKYKGMFTSILPILNNDHTTGVTFHRIDFGIDTGEIIAQNEFNIDLMDNSRDIYHKYIYNGVLLVKKCLNELINKKILNSNKQNFINSSYYSKNSIDFSNISIDLNQVSISIHNQIRAFNFREYQIPMVFNHKIISSKILNTSSNKKTGEVIFENDLSIVISTIDYDMILYKDKVDELFESCKIGNIEIVNKLIQIPKIINIQNSFGWTPLIVAVYNGHYEIVKTLLINGADINIRNFNGTTVLMYAKSSYIEKNKEIIELILEYNNDILENDYFGKSVIDYCKENNEQDVLKIIEAKL